MSIETKKEETVTICGNYRNATGPIRVRMTNDYLFKALLQKNERVLRGLICSLLHLKPDELRSTEIQNPFILGDSVGEKDIILDIKVVINDNAILDLEMQVVNEHNWVPRSLYYVCSNYKNLKSGEDYNEAMPSVHIGFLDFTLFEEHPALYSTYRMLEIKEHYEYTDKLQIGVLDLTKIDLATEEDKAYNIHEWAELFKAQTWEDIKMLAAKNQEIDDAATTIYQLTEDERIRQQCEAREDYLRRQKGMQNLLDRQKQLLDKKDDIIAEQKQEIEALQKEIAKLKKNISGT